MYCPCKKQDVLKTAGIELIVKLVSLKHNIPSNLFIVFDTYKENPRNLAVKPLDGPGCVKENF